MLLSKKLPSLTSPPSKYTRSAKLLRYASEAFKPEKATTTTPSRREIHPYINHVPFIVLHLPL